jgi:hypothetical protein
MASGWGCVVCGYLLVSEEGMKAAIAIFWLVVLALVYQANAQVSPTAFSKLSALPFQSTSEKVLERSEVRWYFYLPIRMLR